MTLPKAHIVRVAYEADRALLAVMNRHKEAKTQWLNLRDQDKAAWVERGIGPKADEIRKRLYAAVIEALTSCP